VVWGWCGAGTDFRDQGVAVNGAWALSGWVLVPGVTARAPTERCAAPILTAALRATLLTGQGVEYRTVDSRPSCNVGGPPDHRG
jgi:hypothetical protein